MCKTIVMGKNTFNSLPKLLPGRKHVILSEDDDFNKDIGDSIVFRDKEKLIEYLNTDLKNEDKKSGDLSLDEIINELEEKEDAKEKFTKMLNDYIEEQEEFNAKLSDTKTYQAILDALRTRVENVENYSESKSEYSSLGEFIVMIYQAVHYMAVEMDDPDYAKDATAHKR